MTIFDGVALVTGAGSGIGRQIAISFAREGCRRIALLDKDADPLEETNRLCLEVEGDVQTVILPVDIRSEEHVNAAVKRVADDLGRVDYAVNCAGIFGTLAPSHSLSATEFDAVNVVNYRGTWLCSRAALRQMLEQEPLPTHDGRPGNRGSIVNVASNLSLVSRTETPAYSASKAAVLSLTKSDAIDYSEHNIRVNCVCPGVIDTPMTKEIPADDPVVHVAPMKRKGTPQEVADAVLFLASPRATFCQGSVLTVDGGYVIN
ncbi:short chain dehydrogenase [Plectosphaerella plurivora]|uniref:Short chain dehydrogenase n=1 Tax=Plectosphaerella plurivora TaxID=936078 RepID=A0A9P9AA96_9PEZI|nr:short chain dehydrogenase [Plectosphaerella plurivora]